MPNLAEEMFKAWGERSGKAIADLAAANEAPGLFNPEWTERAQAEYRRAQVNMAMWRS